MPLRGRAFNAMWSDLLKGYERELDRWHTIEHMPERVGVPGWLRGRRYMTTKVDDHAMFILYEASHIGALRSPSHVASLNNPTEWSKRVQPGLVNFIRGPCQTLISIGDGIGGALAAVRISGDIEGKVEAAQRLMSAAPTISQLHGVTAVHVGQYAESDISGTAEAKLRENVANDIAFIVLVEGIGVAELESATPQVLDITSAASSGACTAGVYRLAYVLDAP